MTTTNVTDINVHRVAPFMMEAIAGFLSDSPDSEFQRGYLAALVNVVREGLGRGHADARLEAAERLLTSGRARP